MKITKFSRPSIHFRPWSLHFSHAPKGGGVVLRGEARLRNVNGIGIFLPHRQIWIEFRRHQ